MATILTQVALGLLASVFFSAAHAKVLIRVDVDAQKMIVTDNDGQTHIWKVSSGREGFETPTGTFNVQRLDAHHFSDEYDQSPMPYSIFFSEGVAIHGTYERGLGRPVSHGCVRLSVAHARLLYSWVEKYGAVIKVTGMTAWGDAPEIFIDNAQPLFRRSGRAKPDLIEVSPPD